MKLKICAFALCSMIVFSSNGCIAGETINKSCDIEGFVIEEESEVEEVVPEIVSLGVCKLTAYCKENYPTYVITEVVIARLPEQYLLLVEPLLLTPLLFPMVAKL